MNAHYYGRVILVEPNFRLEAQLVGVPDFPTRTTKWAISHQDIVAFSLYHGDIVRASIPSLDDQFCKVLEKVVVD